MIRACDITHVKLYFNGGRFWHAKNCQKFPILESAVFDVYTLRNRPVIGWPTLRQVRARVASELMVAPDTLDVAVTRMTKDADHHTVSAWIAVWEKASG